MRLHRVWPPIAALALLLAAYANHFQNGFHFDDDHAIVTNPYVRHLRFVPRFFLDATTFSVLPSNQMYRPVAQTTFAVDYAAAGYDPRMFQLDTFLWFAALLAGIYAMAHALTASRWQALVAAAIFGVHPAIADTVNYIVQRGEAIAALGVVWSLVLFVRVPPARRSGLYLLPVAIGLLAKQTAAAFPAILATYVWMYEDRAWRRELALCVVAIGAECVWMLSRTPPGARYLSATPGLYIATQPFVAVRYLAAFFAPISLSVDPNWPLVTGAGDSTLWVGVAFVGVLGVLVWQLRRQRSTRAIAFGLAWFIVAQLPTALVPLAEVGNDWRMFFPFIGLAIAVPAAVSAVVQAFRPATTAALKGCTTVAVFVLIAETVGVHMRNEVWRTDEALWRDAIAKDALNARAWMNYGVALMARGDYAAAVEACERGLPIAPDYPLLRVNLGVAYGAVGRRADAEREFLTAQRLAPGDWRSHVYYAGWLAGEGRAGEARREFARARELNPVAMSNQ